MCSEKRIVNQAVGNRVVENYCNFYDCYKSCYVIIMYGEY